ncbi:membrane fusion protein (multidrug efflux system) [Chitinophaga dinghuensis]|uniref:Membrane fusion protein (Multidrug efflux system) n=1 Tax=Chitinophaga dinghuensis TaxID=1539050 RepID=A0A327VU18_9BACT|nr:efflux RND transporter periplasmic adaptor subunit [Chitinophaga dinghuensis]RAJ77550.1 membrane fusion protein (multidrug efflux system) [Chitinophaga dinghuensis]
MRTGILLIGKAAGWLLLLFAATGCNQQASAPQEEAARAFPVFAVQSSNATVDMQYPAHLEGKVNVEIRSQADGYLEKIFTDEGAFVQKGQSLFKINDQPLKEQLNTAQAALLAARAALTTAELEVGKSEELYKNRVVSDYQLKAAKAARENAKAQVAQQEAAVAAARINLDFSLIKAPVSGYIGRIPKRIGNLITKTDQQPLTHLSDISEVYAYFSMTEQDFLGLTEQYKGNRVADKIAAMPPVTLLLANGKPYTHSGKVQMIDGQFDANTGAISVRAAFDNKEGILRSGNTGKIILGEKHTGVLLVPVLATLDVQHKVFVYRLNKDNLAERVAISIAGKSGENYLVDAGLKAGDRIVGKDLQLVKEGEKVKISK